MTVHQCDQCKGIAHSNDALRWIVLNSGLEFCSWECLRDYVEEKIRTEKELAEEYRDGMYGT